MKVYVVTREYSGYEADIVNVVGVAITEEKAIAIAQNLHRAEKNYNKVWYDWEEFEIKE